MVELLNFVSGYGAWLRAEVAEWVKQTAADPAMTVVPQSDESFGRGLALYRSRGDKEYSLTDCVSMTVMQEAGIVEVLSNDHHFAQEGFVVLLRR